MTSPSQTKGPGTATAKATSGITISTVEYHGWPDSYLVSNGIAELIVVPAIGRVMQFRMAGGEIGIFWENRALDGQRAASPEHEWANYGGDKPWPAPQQDWPKVMGRAWPPPLGFDSLPARVSVEAGQLVLTSWIDIDYGIQTVRYLSLDPAKAKLAIRTIYHKVLGPRVKTGVWIITQLRHPERVFALLSEEVKRAPGFHQMRRPAPYDFQVHDRMISMRRDPDSNLKIGVEGSSLLWIGDDYVLRIEHDSADGETSIYTNMDPLQYVELETEGPLSDMNPGDRIEMTNSYELSRRTTPDIVAEARQAFGLTQK